MFDSKIMHLNAHAISGARGEDVDTKSRILATATRAFAARGFDAVTVRDITAAAGVNGAAINYHFGSKERLIVEVFRSVIGPIHRERIARLRSYLADISPQRPSIAEVVRMFVEPPIRAAHDRDSKGGTYHRFYILAYALRRPFVGRMLSELSDQVALEFIEALEEALPSISREEVCWRYDFMIGSLVHVLLDVDRRRLRRISGGVCDAADPERMLEQLTNFLVAGFGATTRSPQGAGRTLLPTSDKRVPRGRKQR